MIVSSFDFCSPLYPNAGVWQPNCADPDHTGFHMDKWRAYAYRLPVLGRGGDRHSPGCAVAQIMTRDLDFDLKPAINDVCEWNGEHRVRLNNPKEPA